MLLKKIQSIEFGILSPDQVRKLSAIEIKSPETYDKDGYPMEGGLMDPHLGVINPSLRCKTCGQKMKQCPGHFGSLELVRPVVHPKFSPKLEELLHATCKECGKIALKDETLEDFRKSIERLDKEEAVKVLVKKTKTKRKCPHCGALRLEILLDKPTNFYIDKDRLYPSQIREWVEKIAEDDLKLFGYDLTRLRPEWFILTVLQVPPITIRPSITLESGIKSEDDLTHKLVDVIRINLRLKDNIDAGAPQLIIEDLWDLLQYHITTYFDNDTAGVPPAKHRSGRSLRTLLQRLKGKKGRFRYNLTGKRVNYAARSTIIPDPYLSINQVGVPEPIANNLTIPEYVTEWNMEEMKKFIKKGDKVVYITKPNGLRKKITELNKKEVTDELEVGSKVERMLQDGDIVLFNRQPSLHRLSMLAHEVKVVPNKAIRMNPMVCVSPDTKVVLESGTQITIEDLEKNWENERVRNCTIEKGDLGRTAVTKFWKVSPEELGKKCFEITMENGRKIKVTADHPLYSEKGKVPAENLKKGERLIIKPLNTPLVANDQQKKLYVLDDLAEKGKWEKTYTKSMLEKIKALGLEELYSDDFKARIFARLIGHIFGDGTLIFKGHVARAAFRGEKEDLVEITDDIKRLGFYPEKIKFHSTVSKILTANGKELIVKGAGHSFEVRNKPFCALLLLLGAPNGDKVKQASSVPNWIKSSEKAIKREFLAAYFGAELSAPKQRIKEKSSFQTPIFKMAKIRKDDSTIFIREMENMLNEFGIKIASVYQEKGNIRKDGAVSIIFSVKLSVQYESLLNLYGKIGYIYSHKKERLAGLVFQYLQLKEKTIEQRKLQYGNVHALRAQGAKFKDISTTVGITVPMLERWMYNTKTNGLPNDYISFEEWRKQATMGLGESGLIWEKIEDIREIHIPVVYDITTQSESHNFFANGILSGNCKPYNADFDGDEMNIHVPQTQEGISEARELMYVENQVISPRHGQPVIGGQEDDMTGLFILTMDQTEFTKEEAMHYLYNMGITELPEADRGKKYSGKLIYSQALPEKMNVEYSNNTARLLKGAKIPREGNEALYRDAEVKIEDGKLVQGIVDSSSALVESILRNYTPHELEQYYSRMAHVTHELLTMKGLTISIAEFENTPELEKVRLEVLEDEIREGTELAKKFADGALEPIPGRTVEESFELLMVRLGSKNKMKMQTRLSDYKIKKLFDSKRPVLDVMTMVAAGGRGNMSNVANMSGFWGQISVRTGRPKKGYTGRLIALNEKNDLAPKAGGFVSSNFLQGMNPTEYFMHSMGGRQGEVDTGVATKVSGYLYRRLANSLKDLHVANDETVRTASKDVVQFRYGEDGVFPARTSGGNFANMDEIIRNMQRNEKKEKKN